ncbi:Crp/Fnr family transcriptional regulator [Spirillospora sp. CA-253888]
MVEGPRSPRRLGEWPRRSMLGDLPGGTREALLRRGTRLQVASGETIIMEGDTGCHEVYVLEDGGVKVLSCTPEGGSVLLSIRVAGDLVGELAVLDGGPRLATVTTIGACVLRRIGRRPFLDFLATHPDAALAVSRSVSTKLRNATWHRVEYSSSPAEVRIARILLLLAHEHGEHGVVRRRDGTRVEGTVIRLRLTQIDMAGLAGAAESTVHQRLRALRHNGVIFQGYRQIVIRDWEALHSLAGITEIPPEYGVD